MSQVDAAEAVILLLALRVATSGAPEVGVHRHGRRQRARPGADAIAQP
jgi:hypothetical protein